MKVLLVDDSPYALQKYKTFIEGLGHEVIAAGDAREAINVLMPADASTEPSIDAVVTDTRMGEYSGIYLLQFMGRMGNKDREDPPSTLLHSSDASYTYRGTEFDLPVVVPDAFRFAQFHLKGEDLGYIKEFLAKIA